MITKRTKVQLMIFVLITLLGVSYVGAKYARLDRLIIDDSYTVAAHFADSGGIFAGAEVTYRGVTIGRVTSMELTDDGVDVMLDIEKGENAIPADTRALVGNRSAVGEQYVELQPKSDGEPYLEDGSEIQQSDTDIPITTSKLLTSTSELANSVPKQDLRTVVNEFGAAFKDGGDDLTRLIETSTSFIETANDNFELTRTLIRESNVVLDTQLDKQSAIRSFARDLALLSDTLVTSDADFRKVISNGTVTATTLRRFIEENEVNIGKLIKDLVITGEIQVKNLAGLEQVLILYPYAVAGGFVVNDITPETGLYDAHFGLILQQDAPPCHAGYESTNRRDPNSERGNAPMNEDARCTEPPTVTNARGAQNAPKRVAPGSVPTLGSYDRTTGELTYADEQPETQVTYTGGADESFGEESWKWLLLQPLMPKE
jgi:phospholipid/cholesterol/gamma-HCH transport system substrate-binding protein